ncbi:predicted protein [Naegleria gruberi]|uniref:Predicted protein n=1 Tax=Naegleria gruberi TaxID=5762 RepID=D2VRF3_NAEGR|nr:uncharacterized protein NAEGRDRAFT_71565 [Naegleria gruberi]EFC40598.1 predicted protein [Naegleria gruberi]|eukprot:XP_002673342.1 predicted protein [Naegleria gruberi strain NEG-M]
MLILLIRIALVALVCLLCLKFGIASPSYLIAPSVFIIALDLFYHVNQERDETRHDEDEIENESVDDDKLIQQVITQEESHQPETNVENSLDASLPTETSDHPLEDFEEPPVNVSDTNNEDIKGKEEIVSSISLLDLQDEPLQIVEQITVTPLNHDVSSEEESKELPFTISKKLKTSIEYLEEEELQKIEANAEHFEKVDILLKTDLNFIERAVNVNCNVLKLLKEDELLTVLERYEYLFAQLDNIYQKNVEFVKKVLERNRQVYLYLTDVDTIALLLEEEIISGRSLDDFVISSNLLKRVILKLTKDPKFYIDHRNEILSLLGGDPWLHRCFFPFISDDKEIVIEAVREDGFNLQYASDRLRGDRDVIIVALRNNRLARNFIRRDFYEKYGEPCF